MMPSKQNKISYRYCSRSRSIGCAGKLFCAGILIFLAGGCGGSAATADSGTWQKIGLSIEESEITHVVVHPQNPSTLFISTPPQYLSLG